MRDKDRIIGWSILFIAFILCFTCLPLKPPHSDESGNGFFVNQIWEKGFFTYDPSNYHGPLLFYLFQISEKIFGFGIGSFRFVTALFSLLSVWLILKNRDLLGRYASLFAGSAMALSPGVTFFGRSAIHEPLFVCFQILVVMGFLRARERGERHAIVWCFAGLLGCILLKETFVIFVLSLLLAWGWSEFSPRILSSLSGEEEKKQAGKVKKKKPAEKRKNARSHARTGREAKSPLQGAERGGVPRKYSLKNVEKTFLLKISVVCAVVWFAFYTGFFHHWHGAVDFFSALLPWLKTGVGGSGHDKPFSYWLRLFEKYEWAAAAGLIGALIGLFARSWKMRFFSTFAVINVLVYSFIAYKTPWLVISILWPFVVVAGLWFEVFFVQQRNKPVFWLSLGIAFVIAGHSATAGIRLNFAHYTDPSEPYVYVQTKNDVKVIEDIIGKRIRSSPDAQNMKVQINLKDPWPFPWLFSRFPNIRFGDYRKAFSEKADVIFAELNHDDKDLGGLYWRRMIDVRDAREPIYVYLKKTFFQGIELPGFGPSVMPEGEGT